LRAIFDANVFTRALVEREPNAIAWLDRAVGVADVEVSVPDLVFAEIGNALAGYVRAKKLTLQGAREALEFAVRLPRHVLPVGELAAAALVVAVSRGLSVYDACYVVLAEAEDAVLVTADQRLAAAVSRSELL
jgi:predicted nucleic acid-binding protein